MNEARESQSELLSRIDLIESMVQEGRRKIEYWGWSQVLWGTAYLIAIGWVHWSGQQAIPWIVSMIAATVIMLIVVARKKRAQSSTTASRALGAIWTAVGTALFLYCFSIGSSGHSEIHAYMAAIEIMLGVANVAGGIILRWRAPLLAGFVWWAAAVTTAFVRAAWVNPIFVAATLIAMIGFGLYLMASERRDRQRKPQTETNLGADHA